MKKNLHNRSFSTPAALMAVLSGNAENIMAASTPGGIEAQEKRGQMREAMRETLPVDLGQRHRGNPDEARKPWESLGFKFGNVVDQIFVETVFPAGWTKKPTDHSMWTDIVDEKGRKRGSIFYKAAFYDISAHASLTRRFGVSQTYGDGPTMSVFITDACGKVERRIDGLEEPNWRGDRDKAQVADAKIEAARKELGAWLDKEFPDNNNPAAHWD